MRRLSGNLRRFFEDERGLEVVEYAVIMGLVVVATLVALGTLGVWVSSQYEKVNEEVNAGSP